jgi:glycine/D-amino acid oxidase-like deaminating enzyme
VYSYWQKSLFFRYDHLIVGAGITGCSVAYFLKQHFPQAKVLLVDSYPIPNGASVRNAGMLTFGTPSEWEMDKQSMDLNALLQLIHWRYEGIHLLLQSLPPEAYHYCPVPSYDLCETKEQATRLMESWNEQLKSLFPSPLLKVTSTPFPSFPYAVSHPYEGQIHSGKLMNTFHRYLAMQGCHFLFGSRYLNHMLLSSGEKKVLLASLDYHLEIQTQYLFFCTNAYTCLFSNEMDLYPGRGQILLLQLDPFPELKGNYHYDHGYYYFRQLDSYLLFGGGRHRYPESETTLEMTPTETLKTHLLEQVQCLFPTTSIRVVEHWAGIMAFGSAKNPIMLQAQPGVFYLVRMGGMGVALAMSAAKELISTYFL